MRHKRLKLSVLILLVLGLSGLQAQRVYIGVKEGSQTAYFLSDIKKMSFTSGNITVFKADGGLDTYTLPDLLNLNFNIITSVAQEPHPMKTTGTLHVFPNPVNDILNIQLSSPLQSAGRIEIISMEGKLVYSRAINGNAALHLIDISGLARGLYLCRVKSEKAIETAKIIIQ
jgi:hypothetical protein